MVSDFVLFTRLQPDGQMWKYIQFASIAMAIWLGGIPVRATELSSFQAGNGGWQLGTLAVGNLDSDAQLEIVIPYRDSFGAWFLDAFKPDGSPLPGFPYVGNAEINVSPTLYDLDGDGRDEIIFTCGASVIALRGDGSLVWSNQVNRLNYVPDSGFMTATNGFYWSNGGKFISHLPANAVFSSQVSSPIIADITGTGHKEIVTAWKIDPDNTSGDQDFNPFINDIWGAGEWGMTGETWSGGVVFFDAASGAKNYIYHFHQLVESGLALGHANTEKPLDTYVLNDSDSVVCFDKTKPHGLFGSGNLIGQFGKNQRLLSGSYEQGVDIYTADIDGDGLSEVLVPTTQLNPLWTPSETILDDDGAILWRKWKSPVSFPLNQWQNNACMIPINPDHDNHVDVLSFTHSSEIAFRFWNGVELEDHPGWPKDFAPYLPTPPVVGDVDGDGHEEIIIGIYNPSANPSDGALYVFALDGTLKFSEPVPGGLKHIPTIANVYGDGLDVVCRSLAGRVYIQNFGSTGNDPVSWATHRGNKHRDGNFNAPLFPPGTPLITRKKSGYRFARFSWSHSPAHFPKAWRIYRATDPNGKFTHLMTLTPNATSFTDSGLESGRQYIYEVAAVYDTNEVFSAPFAIVPLLDNNLVANSGFEENENSHWDKWFTGDIDATNMTVSTNVFYQGAKSMEIKLLNNGSGGSISQYGQYGTPNSYMPVTPGTLYSFGGFFKSGGISKPSEHWLEWSSAKTSEDTNNRPPRPYPCYFTPHFAIGTTNTAWTYANRAFILPDGFPNISLTHWFTMTAPGSGSFYMDDVFFRALPSPDSAIWTNLISFGSSWRYSSDAPPPDWFSPDFNDAGWPINVAKFGAGSGPTNIVTALPSRKPAYYYRRQFVLPDAHCEELLLSATCTDAGKPMEIFLNGNRLATTGIEATSGQGNIVRYYDLAPFLNLLRAGTNTIAIVLNNTWADTWDDVAFDICLKTVITNPPVFPTLGIAHALNPAGENSETLNGISPILLNIFGPTNTVWRVESAENLSGPWQFMDTTTNLDGVVSIPDFGQNGRAAPSEVPARFYRLVPD
ncbi:MAG TPA: FG-GAP repeat protein [Verrucomicrobiae bacterium]|nr:FG-GAP repeat protein [Verrucomicrobiae bacterium]